MTLAFRKTGSQKPPDNPSPADRGKTPQAPPLAAAASLCLQTQLQKQIQMAAGGGVQGDFLLFFFFNFLEFTFFFQ